MSWLAIWKQTEVQNPVVRKKINKRKNLSEKEEKPGGRGARGASVIINQNPLRQTHTHMHRDTFRDSQRHTHTTHFFHHLHCAANHSG